MHPRIVVGDVCVFLGGRDKEIFWATGLVKESRMRIMADLRGPPPGPCRVGRGGEVGRKRK